jgi:uncharacterized protein (DUF952 family)
MDVLLHIVSEADWAKVDDAYRPNSVEIEGFIHCSTLDNVLIPANERFLGRQDLLMLVIDQALVTAAVIAEDCEERGIMFPHIYGPLDLEAVKHVLPFKPDNAGHFSLPEALNAIVEIAKS